MARTEERYLLILDFHYNPSGSRDQGRPKRRWKGQEYHEKQDEIGVTGPKLCFYYAPQTKSDKKLRG